MASAGARIARLLEREDLAAHLALFRLAPDGGTPAFRAGQWVKLGLPDSSAGGELTWRPYTIASSPYAEHLGFYVRRVWKPVPGRLTSLLWRLRPGDEVLWRAPRGSFTLETWRSEATPRTLLMLAGGTGLAPFASQVEELWREGSPSPVVLCHGASYRDELGLARRFEELARAPEDFAGRPWRFTYLPTVSRPDHPRSAGWSGICGRVEALLERCAGDGNADLERALGHRLAPERVFVLACGYSGTLDNVFAALHARGFVGPRGRPDGSVDLLVDSFGEE